MHTFLKSMLLFALIFATAYLARILFVPDVMPIADGEQSSWQLQLAFLLTSVQNVGLLGMGLVLLLALLGQLKNLVAS